MGFNLYEVTEDYPSMSKKQNWHLEPPVASLLLLNLEWIKLTTVSLEAYLISGKYKWHHVNHVASAPPVAPCVAAKWVVGFKNKVQKTS